jgi:hypothetical protein
MNGHHLRMAGQWYVSEIGAAGGVRALERNESRRRLSRNLVTLKLRLLFALLLQCLEGSAFKSAVVRRPDLRAPPLKQGR